MLELRATKMKWNEALCLWKDCIETLSSMDYDCVYCFGSNAEELFDESWSNNVTGVTDVKQEDVFLFLVLLAIS